MVWNKMVGTLNIWFVEYGLKKQNNNRLFVSSECNVEGELHFIVESCVL